MNIILITLLSIHTHYHNDFLKFNSEKIILKSAVPLIPNQQKQILYTLKFQ